MLKTIFCAIIQQSNKMEEVINKFALRKRLVLLIIFSTSLLFRIVLINTHQINKIYPDATGYHTFAVNLAKGNGFSLDQNPPFEKSFFREPGYPVFLGICYKLYGLIGDKPSYITEYNIDTLIYDSYQHPEIVFAKYMQAFFDSLSVVVFYLLLLLMFKNSFAFIIALLFGFYYPVAIHSTYLLRETFQLFITLCMSYSFALVLLKKKWFWLLLFSGFWAISNLTLQVTIVIPFFMLIIVWYYSKKIIRAVKVVIISSLLMFVIISPWLIKVYNYYPDLRIIKTFGCSYTQEMRAYQNAVWDYEASNRLTDDEGQRIFGIFINSNSKTQFQKSFDGTYTHLADSVSNLNLNIPLKFKIKKGISNFITSWVFSDVGTRTLLNNFYKSFILFVPVIIGLFAFIGIYAYFNRLLPILLTFICFISLFYLIGGESRRMLPAQPFIFLFGCLGIYYSYSRVILKSKNINSILK